MSDPVQASAAARRAWAAGVVSVVVLAAGAAGLFAMQRFAGAVLVKPPAPLQKPLNDVPAYFPAVTWTDAKGISHTAGPYKAVGPDSQLPPDEVAVLGTREYLLRTYEDGSKRPDQVGRHVTLNLNYYATGTATVHVPEVCWVGNGLQMYPQEKVLELAGIAHANQGSETVPVRLLAFVPLAQPGEEVLAGTNPNQLKCVGYTFHVNGDYVYLPAQVSKEFWNPESKYAYHAKIEVTVGGNQPGDRTPSLCSEEQAAPIVEGFLRASLAGIEHCLPDAAKLRQGAKTDNAQPAGGVTAAEKTR